MHPQHRAAYDGGNSWGSWGAAPRRRLAWDGNAYTWAEFVQFYGAVAQTMWDGAPPAVLAATASAEQPPVPLPRMVAPPTDAPQLGVLPLQLRLQLGLSAASPYYTAAAAAASSDPPPAEAADVLPSGASVRATDAPQLGVAPLLLA